MLSTNNNGTNRLTTIECNKQKLKPKREKGFRPNSSNSNLKESHKIRKKIQSNNQRNEICTCEKVVSRISLE